MESWKTKSGVNRKWDVDKRNPEEFKTQSVIVVVTTVKLTGKKLVANAYSKWPANRPL